MKRVFYGLAVAAVALSASAFTNATSNVKKATVAYITGVNGSGDYTYELTQGDQTCGNGSLPCRVESAGSNPYNFETGGGTITPTELSTRAEVVSNQENY